jgi:activator of 2-hydroxyglutaryl-CoA dehydratase
MDGEVNRVKARKSEDRLATPQLRLIPRRLRRGASFFGIQHLTQHFDQLGNAVDSGFRLGIDTGGTFTDLCLVDEATGRIEVAKVSSTPKNPGDAVINGIKKLITEKDLKPDQISFLIHGTTVATNALLEGKGAPTPPR